MLKAPPVPQMDAGARGFRVDLGELVAASKPTKIDPKGFIVEGIGGAQLGEGLQKGAGAIDKMAAEMARSVNNRRVMEAENRMIEGTQEIAEKVASEPDDTKWVKLASEQADAFQKQILTKDLSPDAHEEINQKWIRWKSYTVRETMQAAFARSRESEALEFDVRRQTFAEAGNPEAADAQTDEAVSKGLISKGVGAKQKAHTKEVAKAKQEQRQVNQTRMEAAADPDTWLKENQQPPEDPVGYSAWRHGQSAAREVKGVWTRSASDEIADALAGPDAPKMTDQDIEKIAAGRLSDAALGHQKELLKQVQNAKWKAENFSEDGVAKNYAALLEESDKFKGKRGDPKADDEYARLHSRIKVLLPEGLRGEVTEPLNRKYTGEGGPKAAAPVKDFIGDTLKSWYNDGRFNDMRVGGITKKVPYAPDEAGYTGDKVYDAATGTYVVKMKEVENPPGRDAARLNYGRAQLHMDQWLKDHPEATFPEAKNEMLKATNAALLPKDVDALMKKPAPATPPAGVDFEAIKRRLTPGMVEPVASVPPGVEPPKLKPKTKKEREIEGAEDQARRNQMRTIPLPEGAGEIGDSLLPPFSE